MDLNMFVTNSLCILWNCPLSGGDAMEDGQELALVAAAGGPAEALFNVLVRVLKLFDAGTPRKLSARNGKWIYTPNEEKLKSLAEVPVTLRVMISSS